MYRPTTTATLLVTVAFSALTGCVTAPHPPPPEASPVPTRPTEPRPDGTTETQIVQAPALEALELIGPSRRPTPSTSSTPKPATSAPAATPTLTAPRPDDERPAPPERPEPPERRPRVEIPPMTETIPTDPPKNSDVCALGHQYGGWGKDTPQAAICKDVYGR
ncbi:hypothetical protein [Streptomyces adelaidensis]|uniref:hypothetical protein n=1 Tax=Streptomyces adelaidensis TaxID=2796465 RepID=UPI001904DDBB|nr:hypothetical protein [Streptomyces adelaidensis]